jgi:hypothetical protein
VPKTLFPEGFFAEPRERVANCDSGALPRMILKVIGM